MLCCDYIDTITHMEQIMIARNTAKVENIEQRVFIDKERPVMNRFYGILEKDLSSSELLDAMQKLIEQDKDFYEPYLAAADILFSESKNDEAAEFLMQAYVEAVARISDEDGNWPDEMEWKFTENRHILRVLEEYGLFLWENDYIDEALELFRRMLCMNPDDEQGVRYNMLAIKMHLGVYDWDEPFIIKDEHGCEVDLDDDKIDRWFQQHAQQFPDEFKWLLDYYAQSYE